jgi:predicted dehydrogenase
MKTEINWGIIGLGKIAHKFANDLRYVPNARLHAVASTDGQKAAEFAKQFGARYTFSSYEGLLNCPHLDVVYIATPHVLHCVNTLMFLRKRISVLCEKPLAINTHEVQMMLETARTNQTFLMEAMWTRFMPSFQKAINLVQSGAIGTPLSLKADFGFYAPYNADGRVFNKNLGGGALLDVGIYPITAALSFLGVPDTIQAVAHIGKTGVDETCSLQFQYQNGAIAMLHASVVTDTRVDCIIYGEKGTIYFDPRFHHSKGLTVHYYTGQNERFEYPYDGFGYQCEAIEVQKCLINNQLESSTMPHMFSLDLMKTMDEVRKQIGLVYEKHDI